MDAAARVTYSANTLKSRRASARSLLRWAHATGRISRDASANLRHVRVIEQPARVARDRELTDALETASTRDRAVILLARTACLRRTEIAQLRVDDPDGNVLRIDGKGGRIRMVWIDNATERALDELDPLGGYYLPGRFVGISTLMRSRRS